MNEYCEGKVESIYEKSKEEPEVYYLLAYEANLKFVTLYLLHNGLTTV